VEREFGTAVEMWKPEGGIFLWLKLPDQVDVTKLIKPAAQAGIAFNPGPDANLLQITANAATIELNPAGGCE